MEESIITSFSNPPPPEENKFHDGVDFLKETDSLESMPGVLISLKIWALDVLENICALSCICMFTEYDVSAGLCINIYGEAGVGKTMVLYKYATLYTYITLYMPGRWCIKSVCFYFVVTLPKFFFIDLVIFLKLFLKEFVLYS